MFLSPVVFVSFLEFPWFIYFYDLDSFEERRPGMLFSLGLCAVFLMIMGFREQYHRDEVPFLSKVDTQQDLSLLMLILITRPGGSVDQFSSL